jgi:peptidoglycan/LPS O-acetylase OafA/YrhL
MGVRLAIGADGRRLKSLVVKQTAAPLLVGLACGLIGAFALAGRLQGLLYGTTPYDSLTLAAVVAVLLVVGLAAAGGAGRRGARHRSIR